MNSNIKTLARLASKKTRVIIGLMSGTSLDGLDVALCKISGQGKSTEVNLLRFNTVPYTQHTKERILEVFAKPKVDFQHLCELNAWIGSLHGELVLQCLKKWKDGFPPRSRAWCRTSSVSMARAQMTFLN